MGITEIFAVPTQICYGDPVVSANVQLLPLLSN